MGTDLLYLSKRLTDEMIDHQETERKLHALIQAADRIINRYGPDVTMEFWEEKNRILSN